MGSELDNKLRKLSECPVHMNVPDGRVMQCKNGHVVCEECHASLDECPSCRCAMEAPGIRCLYAEQIIELIIKISCMYSKSGCEFKGMRNEVDNHQLQCKWKPFKCLHPDCSKMVSIAGMADHAVSDHKGNRQAAKSSEFSVTYKGCLDDERDTFPVDVVTHQDLCFIPILYKVGGIFYSWLHVLGDAKTASGYMIMMSVGHDSATKTTIIGKAFSYVEQDIVLKHKEQLLSFTKSQAGKYIKTKGSADLNISFHAIAATFRNNPSQEFIESAKKGKYKTVKLFLQCPQINVNYSDKDGRTALYIASKEGLSLVVKQILTDTKVDVNKGKTDTGATPLFFASQEGHLEVVEMLLGHPKIDVNKGANTTALLAASHSGHLEVVKQLLNHRLIDVNKGRVDTGATALFMASQYGHSEVVRLLLDQPKIDVNKLRTDTGTTALIVGAENGHTRVVMQLLGSPKIDVNKGSNTTALVIASRNGHTDVVKLLLCHTQIDVNKAVSSGGSTALLTACQNGQLEVVKLLLGSPKLDINKKNKDEGATALFVASQTGHLEVVKLLLCCPKTDMQLKNRRGKSPIDIAKEKGHTDIIHALAWRKEQ